jgi:putative aldouronate transport system permease protein
MNNKETVKIDGARNTTIKKPSWLSSKRLLQQNLPLYLLFVPVLIYFVIFKYGPMFGMIIAFKDYNFYDGIWGSPWIGLKNFELIFQNPQSLQIIRNTLVLSVSSIIIGFPFPIVLAILLNEVRKLWFKRAVQTLLYLPHFFSWVIVGGMVVTIFSMESGIVNHWIERWSGHTVAFLYKPVSWIAIYLGSGIWKEAGFSAIIYLAALTSIDSEIYEAAAIDGANKWRQIWNITLPGLRPTIVLMFILSMGRLLEVGFDQVYVMQNPIVSNVSEVISTYIYRVGIQGTQFGLTAAMGLFESIIGLIMIITANQVAKRFGYALW